MKRDRWLLSVAAALIIILLVLFAIGRKNAKDTELAENQWVESGMSENQLSGDDTASQDTEIPDELQEGPDMAEDETEYIKVPLEEFKRNVDTSTNLWEFTQRFFDDVIVYKTEAGKFVYEPIDRSLPQSDYNWDNLKEVGLDSREVEYVENGETVSIKGIDVSKYQDDIDWEKVAASGVKFAFIRLGYRGYSSGALVVDEKFEYNITEALRNGIEVGVYFVTQAVSVDEAVEEAEFVLDTIKPYRVSWPVVLDIEDAGNGDARTQLLTRSERTDYACAFCDRIKQSARVPMVYTNIRWFIEKLDISRLTEYDKWFAQYFNRPFFPYAFQIWQYTSSGKIDGIKGNVDLNISFVDYSKGE